ncbi:Kinesin-like protein [Melia azedarach]|uniref:Kinesin-like protein n=1 Tax=Melia azedarach TaxID=155640 RepID=A0ACC1X5R6_MELAZ|nr:Kinesin-like protein [Melia azedarach]
MERIHVTVRSRPLSPEDTKTSPWRISGNSIFIPNHTTKFEFDRIFGEECKTLDVYEARTRDIVAAAVRGFNGTVFAYGQTNSGKTHTMRGSPAEPGVIPLAVHDLFDIIQGEVDREFLLRMSYMEIYNEDINDLLAPEHRKLQIHENLERGIYVAGLREEIVASPQQVLDFMEFGESHRHFGETNMNLYSSRSHTIFRMIIESRDKTEDDNTSNSCDAVRVSVLNLVDLAGSERAAKTGAEGVRLKEGSHINKSLMTLGTVIKKLSEGAESQGGHVPYRDSKLTRILQPALGGNANTAIICNITLAQIHADETKSSLQFASRALCVTNCARVNEILTDAALLKRQKKEIEELRAKLQASHSEHLEEEVLSLRNTLLQSELERESIALELEEEKKAQAEREKVLQEQAKKIKNLSSMVLYSNRDENREHVKKEKRRDTWCPSNLSREILQEVYANVQSKASDVKSVRPERNMGPLLPFEELVNETELGDESCEQEEDCRNDSLEDCNLPDPCALLNITNRRKVPLKKQSSSVEDSELMDLQAEYEDLLLKFESQRTISEIQIDFLTRKLDEADWVCNGKCKDSSAYHGNKNVTITESETNLVIKQLQEKIKMLEVQKSSSQQNLDNLVELAMERDMCANEKFEELHEELLNAREEARVAREQLASSGSTGITDEGTFGSLLELSEVQEIISEVQNTKEVVDTVSLLADEAFKSLSAIYNEFLDFKGLMGHITVQQHSVISNHEKLHCCMREKVSILECEKLHKDNQSFDLWRQIQEIRTLSEQQNLENREFLTHIQTLEKELSCLSSSSLTKEKESLRKDLEKTKTKLKETESKLKNAIQEKTKLEGEKAFAEREVKRLHGQKTLLERDISKRDSFAGRRRDSFVDKNSKVFDPKKGKSFGVPYEQMQEDYKKLEVLAFEMETTIASLEEQLATAYREKEEAMSRNENLASEMEALSESFSKSSTELNVLQEEISDLRIRLEESKLNEQNMESSIRMLLEEKEELAMQLTNTLLEMEEEKAIWSAKEKASIEAIEEKAKLHNAEITSLSKGMLEVRNELESYREECESLRERLASCEEEAKLERKCSMGKATEIDQLRNDLKVAEVESHRSQEMLRSNLEKLSLELHCAHEKVDTLQKEIIYLSKEREDLFLQIRGSEKESGQSNDLKNVTNQLLIVTEGNDKLMTQLEDQQRDVVELEDLRENCNDAILEAMVKIEELTRTISDMEIRKHTEEVKNNKEKAKFRTRLRGTQALLDAFRYRYKQMVNESDIMNKEFEEASASLKDRLALKGIEVLNLKKQLAAAMGR